MPRFKTKTLLMACVLVAFWICALKYFAAPRECRRTILLTIFLAAGASAVCFRGKRRAFWTGFFVSMLLVGLSWRPFPVYYVPDFEFVGSALAQSISRQGVIPKNGVDEAGISLHALLILGYSAAVGFITAYIYEQSQRAQKS